MSPSSHIFAVTIAVLACCTSSLCATAEQRLNASPSSITLIGPESSQQILVTLIKEGRSEDLTRLAVFEIADDDVVKVTSAGKVFPQRDGTTSITVRRGTLLAEVPVVVQGFADPAPLSFRHDVLPILSKARCNSGGCHGKAEGQNGFKLSVFGFDPTSDYEALVRQGRGRRVSVSAPASSLVLRKATAETPHGGGQKMDRNGLWYQRVSRWIQEGAAMDAPSLPTITAIEVEPSTVVMRGGTQQQLRVTAIDSHGLRRCVTGEAEYESNAVVIAGVDRDGLVSVSELPGEAAILVRYMEQVAVCRVTLPQTSESLQRPDEFNFIDKFAIDKLQRLGLQPSELCDDATFLRRAYLDTIGTLPTIQETQEFLASRKADKREQLVCQLLMRDEYADYWTMRWADILRVDQAIVTPQGAVGMTRWIHKQFRDNTPYDQFARQVVTARGNTQAESPASFFQVHQDAEMAARSISQVFLGVRLECAQCHHHPGDRWSQSDYYAFANLFADVGRTKIKSGGLKIVRQTAAPLKHPRTGEVVVAAALGSSPMATDASSSGRDQLATWMTSPDNPYFAQMIVNRLWAHYFGRGLVEPIDDLRATNPPTNEPLLSALASHLREVNYDLKAFTKTLLASRTYQLASHANQSNHLDQQSYSHATWKALPAEVLLDAICDATGICEEFTGWPAGYRAIEVWDNRMPSYFFRVFGRPQRVSVCECERGNEPSIAQALHLMNSDETVRKLRHRDGRAAALVSSSKSDDEIIEQLYLATLCRLPAAKESALMRQAFSETNSDRRAASEDILWTLLNSREFIYNH